MTEPTTLDEAITLLQKLGWDEDELSPEERQAFCTLYNLAEEIPLPRGSRTLQGERYYKEPVPVSATIGGEKS